MSEALNNLNDEYKQMKKEATSREEKQQIKQDYKEMKTLIKGANKLLKEDEKDQKKFKGTIVMVMTRDYNDLYPYLDDEAKRICELSEASKDFVLGSLDFRLYGIRMKISKLGDGEITEKEWATYTADDIEKLVNRYGCPVTGYKSL